MTTSLNHSVLDNPAWTALTGPHLHLARRHGHAARYPSDVSPFAALASGAHIRGALADLARVTGPGNVAMLAGGDAVPPPDWEVVVTLPGVQLVASSVDGVPDAGAEPLTAADVPDMLDLVARTRPGPFLPRTIELGSYLGIRHGGRLVAMAGERLHPPGHTEISAVCTDPDHRGRGLATRLILAVAAGIRARGETPFLHAATDNTNAIRLYEHLGFRHRRDTLFQGVRVPAAGASQIPT